MMKKIIRTKYERIDVSFIRISSYLGQLLNLRKVKNARSYMFVISFDNSCAGKIRKGVTVFSHADLMLHTFERCNSDVCWIIIYKVWIVIF